MSIPGLGMLRSAAANAVTFELLLNFILLIHDLFRTYGPNIGSVLILLFMLACVVFVVPDPFDKLTTDGLLSAGLTLLQYICPWIGFRYLLKPGNRFISVLARQLFDAQCHRLNFYRFERLVIDALLLVVVFYRIRPMTRIREYKFRQTLAYSLVAGCYSSFTGGTPATTAALTGGAPQVPPQPPPQLPPPAQPPTAPALRRSQRTVKAKKPCTLSCCQ